MLATTSDHFGAAVQFLLEIPTFKKGETLITTTLPPTTHSSLHYPLARVYLCANRSPRGEESLHFILILATSRAQSLQQKTFAARKSRSSERPKLRKSTNREHEWSAEKGRNVPLESVVRKQDFKRRKIVAFRLTLRRCEPSSILCWVLLFGCDFVVCVLFLCWNFHWYFFQSWRVPDGFLIRFYEKIDLDRCEVVHRFVL